MSATLFLSAADATPMYRQIVDQIAARVMAGVIVTRHGKGSFVADSTDPTRARLHGELLRQIDALLLSAERLGFTTPELQDLIATRRAEGDPS